MQPTKEEQDELLKAILATQAFDGAKLRKQLLEYLAVNRDAPVSGKDISQGAFGLPLQMHDDQRIRERCKDLRDRLKEFILVTDLPSQCELPKARHGQGYQLRFQMRKEREACRKFWQVHTQEENITLVFAEPMFFYDFQTTGYIRFLDSNPRLGDDDAAFAQLEKLHGNEVKNLCGEGIKERLRPMHIFVGIGEVAAIDALCAWFDNNAAIEVKKASDDIPSVADTSPILLGSMRTNRFIKTYLGSDEGKQFRYRIHESKIGFLSIENATEGEKTALSDFPLHQEGTCTVAGRPQARPAARDRFVVVTRMRKPGSNGSVTIISSDTSLAIKQVALALTNESQATEILERTGWRQGHVPVSFEILFSVRIAPGDMRDEAGLAILRTFCKHA